jgi:D-serine deaminase-like pyridoxal phosphate-dependent protein
VVSHAGGRVVLDAGSKALGADRAPWATGFGRLLDHPDARITSLSEHHAVVAWPDQHLPEVGSRLRVVPNHVCAAVNLADELVVARGGETVDVWPVAARGANT